MESGISPIGMYRLCTASDSLVVNSGLGQRLDEGPGLSLPLHPAYTCLLARIHMHA